MRTFPRLLAYLKPYTPRLAVAITCMVLYAAAAGLTLGLFAPFMQILFAPQAATVAASRLPGAVATPGPAGEAARALFAQAKWGSLDRWPAFLRTPLEGFLFGRPPLEALGRSCLLLLAAFL